MPLARIKFTAVQNTVVSQYVASVYVLDNSAMTGVPLEVMLRFNRLKALTTDEAVVAAALRKSSSGLMEVKTEECIFSRLV